MVCCTDSELVGQVKKLDPDTISSVEWSQTGAKPYSDFTLSTSPLLLVCVMTNGA